LIQSNVSVVQWSDWLAKFTKLRAPDRFAVRFDRAQMSLDAATQGLGVALESSTIASRHIADGKLVPLFARNKSIRVKAHYAVYPTRHAKRPAVAAFMTWLRERAARDARLS
jgi:DNA-binding transcriptional LysR family regulator